MAYLRATSLDTSAVNTHGALMPSASSESSRLISCKSLCFAAAVNGLRKWLLGYNLCRSGNACKFMLVSSCICSHGDVSTCLCRTSEEP